MRTTALAAAELYRHGKIGKMVVAVEPHSAEMLSANLRLLLQERLKDGDLVVIPNGVTTVQEIKTFKKIAKEKGWKNLTSIANHAHERRIRRIAESMNLKEEVQGVRNILVLYPRYDKLVNQMLKFPEQGAMDKHEDFFHNLAKVPILGPFIADIVPQVLPLKIAVQFQLFKHMEKKCRNYF